MGRKSIKENKNYYQVCREKNDLTRNSAADLMEYVSSDRIDKIEREISLPHPEEIIAMSKAYKSPELCNYYCSHECPIGKGEVPELKLKTLSQITLEVLASLNSLEKEKTRLIEITVDGYITDDEIEDFKKIQDQLSQISIAIDSLKLWVKQAIIDGSLNK